MNKRLSVSCLMICVVSLFLVSFPPGLRRESRCLSNLSECLKTLKEISGRDAITMAKERAVEWKALQRKGVTEHNLTPHLSGLFIDGKMELFSISGIPKEAKWIEDETVIYRHYTSDEAIIAEIRKLSALRPGPTSYEILAPKLYRKVFRDISGVFLTKPSVGSGQVGRPGLSAYVDIRVKKGTPVLELEPENIYVVPLPRRLPDWVKEVYAKFSRGESVGRDHQKMCEEIRAQGGIWPDIYLPVDIVSYGMAK